VIGYDEIMEAVREVDEWKGSIVQPTAPLDQLSGEVVDAALSAWDKAVTEEFGISFNALYEVAEAKQMGFFANLAVALKKGHETPESIQRLLTKFIPAAFSDGLIVGMRLQQKREEQS
jgi:hypothetical protein